MTISKVLDFDLFQHQKHKFTKNQNSELLKLSETTVLDIAKSLRLISRKNWVAEKSWNFHITLMMQSYEYKHYKVLKGRNKFSVESAANFRRIVCVVVVRVGYILLSCQLWNWFFFDTFSDSSSKIIWCKIELQFA